jgi:hypothetical protein
MTERLCPQTLTTTALARNSSTKTLGRCALRTVSDQESEPRMEHGLIQSVYRQRFIRGGRPDFVSFVIFVASRPAADCFLYSYASAMHFYPFLCDPMHFYPFLCVPIPLLSHSYAAFRTISPRKQAFYPRI